MKKLVVYAVMLFMLTVVMGCSNPMNPQELKTLPSGQQMSSHQLWGLWQFIADPARETLDVVPLRMGEMHINALPFLEPPALVNLTLESLKFNGNIIDADIGLRHPFLGLSEFTGFDVCGVLISNGSVTGFEDPDLRMAGVNNTQLLNPDGWTRWWNPAEFPIGNTMFNYKDGLLGTPDSIAGYNSTLNAYKLFCDELTDPAAPISDVDMKSRCVFSAGQKNIRHYTIKIGITGLIFNYAIDANWQFPDGPAPWAVPDDFGPNANRVEAWNMSITELDNTLWNDGTDKGGDLSLLIDVWDHYNAGLNTVKVESAGNFISASSATPVTGGEGYSTYQVDITDATPGPGSIGLFITIESEAVDYQDLLPGKTVSSYFKHSVPVSSENPQPEPCGTGNFGTPTSAPFTDMVISVVKFELAWLVSGPYAGEMIVGGGQSGTVGTIRRYNMDTVGGHSGSLFITLPDGSLGPFWGVLYHLEVEPKTGRVIVVPDGLGVNNSMLVYDNQGNLLSSTSGISAGANRKIIAMDANVNGDLWLLTANYVISATTGSEVRLERWAYQDSAPYIAHDITFDLNVDKIFGDYDSKTGNYYYHNNVYDLAILYPEQRIFVLKGAGSAQNNGILSVFDLNTDSPPTYRDDLSDSSLFSSPCWFAYNDYFKVTEGAIWCDHSNSKLDGCRVIAYARTVNPSPTYKTSLARLDRDGKVLNEVEYPYSDTYTIGVNEDPNPVKNYLILAGYPPAACNMSLPPSDW